LASQPTMRQTAMITAICRKKATLSSAFVMRLPRSFAA
jgi:hypothetical protein